MGEVSNEETGFAEEAPGSEEGYYEARPEPAAGVPSVRAFPADAVMYRISGAGLSLRDFGPARKWHMLPSFVLMKVFRFGIPVSVDVPATESIRPFEIAGQQVHPILRQLLQPPLAELASLGFGVPIYHDVDEVLTKTSVSYASAPHHSLPIVARVKVWAWSFLPKPQVKVSISYLSAGANGVLVHTTQSLDTIRDTPNVHVTRLPSASAAQLLDAHRSAMTRLIPGQPVSVRTPDQIRAVLDRDHEVHRDDLLRRRVFVPKTAAEERQSASLQQKLGTNSPHAAILADIDRLQNATVN